MTSLVQRLNELEVVVLSAVADWHSPPLDRILPVLFEAAI